MCEECKNKLHKTVTSPRRRSAHVRSCNIVILQFREAFWEFPSDVTGSVVIVLRIIWIDFQSCRVLNVELVLLVFCDNCKYTICNNCSYNVFPVPAVYPYELAARYDEVAQPAEVMLMYSCSNVIVRFGCRRMNGEAVVHGLLFELLCLILFP
jgi:hypothetical protein